MRRMIGDGPSPIRSFGRSIAAATITQRRLEVVASRAAAGTFAFTAPVKGFYRLALVGSGGTGGVSSQGSPAGAGGGSGAAVLSARFPLDAGQQISVTVAAGAAELTISTGTRAGNPGNASSATLPDGSVITAGGGQGGGAIAGGATAPGGLGGVASGGALNQTGNSGGNATPGAAGSTGAGGFDVIRVDGVSLGIVNHSPASGAGAAGLHAAGGASSPILGGILSNQVAGSVGVLVGSGSGSSVSAASTAGSGSGGAVTTGTGAMRAGATGSGAAYLLVEAAEYLS